MAVFPIIKPFETTVQVGDKVRLDASKTFLNQGDSAISTVEIQPESGGDFYDVTDSDSTEWYLDWVYSSDDDYTATVRVTQDDATETTSTATVTCVTSATDSLFSDDEDLRSKESDILNWLPGGYSNWNHLHRKAQEDILDWLDELRIYKADGTRWVASELTRSDQVRRISMYMVLRMIFGSLSNQVDDIYADKHKYYWEMEVEAKQRNYIELDFGGDTGELNKDFRTFRMVKR